MKRTRRWAVLASGLLMGTGLWWVERERQQSAVVAPVLVTVLAQPQQTIKGWGCYPATYHLEGPNARDTRIFERPYVQKLLLRDLGISFLRCHIPPQCYDARRDDGSLDTRYLDASLVCQLQMARRYGLTKYLLTVWSPPALFKNPPVTTGHDKAGKPSRLRREREADYCRYVVRVLDYLTKRKGLLRPLAYSIQNEPGYAAAWDGTVYDAVQWQRVFKAMRYALDQGGYRDVMLIGPECGSYALSTGFVGGPQASAMCHDPALARSMAGFAFHGYNAESRLAPHPQQLCAVAQTMQGMGKDVWMTEWCLLNTVQRSPLDHALEVMQRLGREMAYIPTNYWAWWQGWHVHFPHDSVLVAGPDEKHLHISKTYWVLRKLWHCVPAGSVVHRVRTSDPDLKGYDPYAVQMVAFSSPQHLTVLMVNPTAHDKRLHVNGLTGSTATMYATTQMQDMAKTGIQRIVNGQVDFGLPARSIILLATD